MVLQALITGDRRRAVDKRFFILLGGTLFLIIFTVSHYLFMINDLINFRVNQEILSSIKTIGLDGPTGQILVYKLNQPVMGFLPISDLTANGIKPLYLTYFQLLIPLLVSIFVYFLWYEHRTLGFIPKDMDLMLWQAGLWRPSLILLHRANDARHKYLSYTGMFLIFPVVIASLGGFEMAMFFMLPVVMFAPIAIFRVISDYRLINKGIPVECHLSNSRKEHAMGGRTEINWDIKIYQADYKDKSYYIENTSEGLALPSITLVALINPARTNGGVLLNSFYKKKKRSIFKPFSSF